MAPAKKKLATKRKASTSSRSTSKKELSSDKPAVSAGIDRKDLKDYHKRMKVAGVHRVANVVDSRATVTRRLSTQSLALDVLLDGGLPLGKVIEMRGPPHVGKSTVLDHMGAQAQKEGGLYALADTELSRAPVYSKALGVDVEAVQYLEWEDTEQVIENVVNAVYETIQFWKVRTTAPVVIGWDALGSTSAADDVKKGLGSKLENKADGSKRCAKPGAAAKAMRMAMRQIAPAIAGTSIVFVVLNHEYEVVNMHGTGPKRKPYGGQGLTYAVSLILNLWPSDRIKDPSGKILGREVRVTLDKDRLSGKTYQSATLALLSGIGIDNTYSILQDLKRVGVIVTSGSWSAINLDGDMIKFQGWRGLVDKCAEDETLFSRLTSVYHAMMEVA